MRRLLLGTMGVKSLLQGLNAAATAGFEPRTVWSEVRRRKPIGHCASNYEWSDLFFWQGPPTTCLFSFSKLLVMCSHPQLAKRQTSLMPSTVLDLQMQGSKWHAGKVLCCATKGFTPKDDLQTRRTALIARLLGLYGKDSVENWWKGWEPKKAAVRKFSEEETTQRQEKGEKSEENWGIPSERSTAPQSKAELSRLIWQDQNLASKKVSWMPSSWKLAHFSSWATSLCQRWWSEAFQCRLSGIASTCS